METNPLIQDFLSQPLWAVVGASSNQSKYGYKVYAKLKELNYTVMPVNPNLEAIDGDACYPSVNALPVKPDAVSIIVPPKVTEQVILNCITGGIKKVWMQPGAESSDAIKLCEDNDIQVIHHRCILIETKE